jgi:hypothetical protein
MTSKEGVVYVHVLAADAPERLILPETAGLRVRDARLFGSGREVAIEMTPDVTLHLPLDGRHPVDTTIVLRLR